MRDDDRRAAGFAFARALADPQFRARLHKYGVDAPHDVVIALAGEPWEAVRTRVVRRCRPPALVAIPMGTSDGGFLLLFLDTRPSRNARMTVEQIAIDPDGSVGDLYTNLSRIVTVRAGDPIPTVS